MEGSWDLPELQPPAPCPTLQPTLSIQQHKLPPHPCPDPSPHRPGELQLMAQPGPSPPPSTSLRAPPPPGTGSCCPPASGTCLFKKGRSLEGWSRTPSQPAASPQDRGAELLLPLAQAPLPKGVPQPGTSSQDQGSSGALRDTRKQLLGRASTPQGLGEYAPLPCMLNLCPGLAQHWVSGPTQGPRQLGGSYREREGEDQDQDQDHAEAA